MLQRKAKSSQLARDSVCARCKEIELENILSKVDMADKDGKTKLWRSKRPQDDRAVLLQRCIFDVELPLVQNCPTCRKISEATSPTFTFPADPNGDTSTHGGTSFSTKDSWFEMEPDGSPSTIEHYSWLEPHHFSTRIMGRGAPIGYYIGDYFGLSSPALTNSSHPMHALHVRQVPKKLVDYSIPKEWLASCCRAHVSCEPDLSSNLHHIRLIDVENRSLVPFPQTGKVSYATLSYVWGNVPSRSYKLGLLHELPHTIEDAITVSRGIGIPYLWADYVCIDQADQVYKSQQIGMMDIIYGGAFVTIVSLNGSSADEGLPRVGDTAKYVPQAAVGVGRGNSVISMMPPLDRQLSHSSWRSRAWTFQETLLSNRRLIFSRHQMYYACNEMTCAESSLKSKPAHYQQQRDEPNDLVNPFAPKYRVKGMGKGWELYRSIASSYAKRKLTHQSDALNAVSGLLQRLTKTHFPEGFLFGLPQSSFRFSLLWFQDPQSVAYSNYDRQTLERREELPSWAWLGWKWTEELNWLHQPGGDWQNDECSWCQIRQPSLKYSEFACEAVGPCKVTKKWKSNVPESLKADLDEVFYDLPDSSTSHGSQIPSRSGLLAIKGIVLRIHVVLRTVKGSRYDWGKKFKVVSHMYDRVNLAAEYRQRLGEPTFRCYLDGPVRRLLQDGVEKEVDFLLLALQHSIQDLEEPEGPEEPEELYNLRSRSIESHKTPRESYGINLHMLMLEWKTDIAYRVAVCTLEMKSDRIRELGQITEPRLIQLCLG